MYIIFYWVSLKCTSSFTVTNIIQNVDVKIHRSYIIDIIIDVLFLIC